LGKILCKSDTKLLLIRFATGANSLIIRQRVSRNQFQHSEISA
jgi:hypothetical protein